MAKEKNKCEHYWRLFRDVGLKDSGLLSFFCPRCLRVVKIKKEYENYLILEE